MQYRPEIDGLRALAILPVIFFHADFIWFSGGLLGVDVFFVISGYLISSIILTEQQQQRFSLMYFYERRARRILPALFFVLLCSSIAAGFILAPHALVDFSYSVMATVGFVANLFFWQTTGYFDGDAALKPLLHLWSLGIEEQFYLFFPLLLVWGWRWRSAQQLKIVLALLFIGSLAAAQWSSQTHSDTGFYLLPMRAWELLAGVFCAYYLQYVATKSHLHTPLALQQLGSIAGLLLLGISFVLLGAPTSHPSLWTLVPVGGTVLIIIYATPRTWVARLLSLRPLVLIGLLSYSAYLWHQPLFAFTRFKAFSVHLSLTQSWLLIVATFTLAAISWCWVETPFRNRQFLSRKAIFISSLVGIVGFLSLAGTTVYEKGFPQRFNNVQQILLSYTESALDLVGEDACFLNHFQSSEALGEHCKINDLQPIAILGDSHASALWYGLITKTLVARYSASGCAPLLGEEISASRPFCPEINRFNFTEVAEKQPHTIILHANWLLYRNHLTGTDKNQILARQLHETIAYLHDIAPQSRIYVLGDVPQWPPSLITILTRHAKDGMPDEWLENSMYKELKPLDDLIRANTPPPAQFISLLDLLCKPNGECRALLPIKDGWAPLTWDANHLSRDSAAYVAEELAEMLDVN